MEQQTLQLNMYIVLLPRRGFGIKGMPCNEELYSFVSVK